MFQERKIIHDEYMYVYNVLRDRSAYICILMTRVKRLADVFVAGR